jgi:hypothetical protein
VKKPPGDLIVDRCAALSSSLEVTLKLTTFRSSVICYNTAVQLIAKQESGGVGCVLVDLVARASAET